MRVSQSISMTFFSPSSHAAELHALDRNPIDGEDDLLLRQPHHQRAVGVVLADIVELERGPTERDVAVSVDDLIGDGDVIRLELDDQRQLQGVGRIRLGRSLRLPLSRASIGRRLNGQGRTSRNKIRDFVFTTA
jgi:hypothetical protein